MHPYFLELLECPICHGELRWTITERDAERILAADIHCRVCSAPYAVHDSIGISLTPDLPREGLWQQTDSQLTQILRRPPELERQLMSSPLDTLGPADQFFRALVLEERGNYAEAISVHDFAQTGLYTAVIDSLPVTETLLECCTLLATGQTGLSKTLSMNTGNVPLAVNRSRSM